MNLSPKQSQAVQRAGQDVCVTAGPGSGKTRVLIERFRWLVEENHVSPLRILTITFTEKAATEIKERLTKALEGDPQRRSQIERAYVSTIHGFCVRLLKENAIAAGLDPGFSVMDDAQRRQALEEATHDSLDQLFEERPGEIGKLLEAIHVSTYGGGFQADLAKALISAYEAMRVAGRKPSGLTGAGTGRDWISLLHALLRELQSAIEATPPRTAKQREQIENLREWMERGNALAESPPGAEHFHWLAGFPTTRNSAVKSVVEERMPELKETLIGAYYAPLHDLLVEAVCRLDEIYRRRKREQSALDFSDLEEKAIELLQTSRDVRAGVTAAFDQILMDELQDTNRLQWTLLELVRRPDRFFAVGDINQSIYGFRHAEPEVFQEYRRGIEAAGRQIDTLWENHRSRAEILAAAGVIFQNARGIEARRLEARRPFAKKPAPSVEVIVSSGAVEDPAWLEAQWIARRIQELAGSLIIEPDGAQRPARFRDIAVLARKVKVLVPIARALREFGIPYLTTSGREFFEAREVRDLVHLLRVVANPRDEIAVATVLRSPLVGAGDETLLRLKHGGNLGAALLGLERREDLASFDAIELESLRCFRRWLKQMRAERDDVSPDRLLLRAIEASGYREGLDARARSNVDKLLAICREWFDRHWLPLATFLQHLARLRTAQSEPDAPPDDSSDVVRLMTIHQAKGLQFPIVFIPALQAGVDRRKPPVCFSREGALGVSWRDPSTGKRVSDPVHAGACRFEEEREEDESQRLLYVAMTRAEEHLVLSFSDRGKKLPPWPELVMSGLGVTLDGFDNRPTEHLSPQGDLTIRLLRVDQPPERAEPPLRVETAPADVAVFPKPAVTDQHDSTVSVTSLLTFSECPRRYYLSRYLGWEAFTGEKAWVVNEEETETRGGIEFGRQVHALLAGEEVEGASAEALELADRFRRSELGRRAARAVHAEREFDFLMAEDDLVLRGQIDLWFEEGGELIVLDYKTDAVAGRSQTEAAGDRYALQLRLYALALKRLTGKLPDRAFVCLLRPGVAVPIELDADKLAEALGAVTEFRRAQSSLRFDTREGGQCYTCPFFRRLCPAGRTKPNGRRTSSSREPS